MAQKQEKAKVTRKKNCGCWHDDDGENLNYFCLFSIGRRGVLWQLYPVMNRMLAKGIGWFTSKPLLRKLCEVPYGAFFFLPPQ
jgi:hypothetical protein